MYSVMLVDDEQFARKGLRALIDWRACGLEVTEEADNGEDALLLIKDKKPDIVITDIRMPVLDGLELIRAVNEQSKGEAPAFIIISGYNDFKYAQQAVRYGVHDFILKPIDQEEMTRTLIGLHQKLSADKSLKERNEELLISSVIEMLIMGEASDEKIAEWEQRLPKASGYRYLFVELNDVHPWMHPADSLAAHDAYEFKPYTQTILRQLIPEFRHMLLHEHRGRLGMIVSDALLSRYDGDIASFMQTLRGRLTQKFGNRVFVYAGMQVERLSQVHESFRTAKEALSYKYVHDETKTIVYQDLCDRPLQFIEADRAIRQTLLEQLEENKTDEIRLTVERLFDEFRSNYFAPEAIKMNIHQIATAVAKMIKEMGGDERELISYEAIISWHDLNVSLSELKRLLTNFVVDSSQLLKQLRKECAKGGIHRIKQYIEAHFHKNISLKSIAAEFYMNPVYLGQLFKKHYGMYFNDYLLRLRVNEAKKLLRQTDLRIYEIAEKVGFSNAEYFVTQFEKTEQMTPSEYRSKLLQ
ncbi:response regulator transcription factor [Paenibacillus ginsengihumi]|uniref:response regulator transcription factor n=1 Tax=Paenibacillus ginsengihumi TaxID=431596 RepID=UPI000363360E|nr:response regulator transcription factor [Paenibacillus ginsengihumi]